MEKSLLLVSAFSLVLASCNVSQGPELPDEISEVSTVSHGMIVLGEKLDDPYSLSNMTKALQSLYPSTKGRTDIATTDVYVRFLPEDESDFDRLTSLGVQLYDHPFDYSIRQEGDYYHDPSLPENSITWQYAVVKPGFTPPSGMRYEVLDECYIPDNDKAVTRASDGIDWDAVEREAYRLSGNESLLMDSPSFTKGGESIYPSGEITISDPSYNGGIETGVEGVKVSANTFVKFSSAYTDEDGHYELGKSFSSSPRYRIIFENRKGFGIGLNLVLVRGSVSTLGKNPSSGVSVRVDTLQDRKMFCRCVANNAAYDYFNTCADENFDLPSPPLNLRLWLFQKLEMSAAPMLQQGAVVDGSVLEQFLGDYIDLVKMFLPDLVIGLKGVDDFESIYTLTQHELAHASHYTKCGKDFWNQYVKFLLKSFVTSGFRQYGLGTERGAGYCEVAEMWAYYLQNVLHGMRYPDSEETYGSGYWFSPQIFSYMGDRGLSCRQIFESLTSRSTDAESLKQELIDLYPEEESMISQAFERYGK